MPTFTMPTMSTSSTPAAPASPGQRRAKSGGIFGSLIGMLIGLALVVIASPYFLWLAHSQYRGKDFQTATVVQTDSNESGYIVVEGAPAQVDALTCPEKGKMVKPTPTDRLPATTTTAPAPSTTTETVVVETPGNCVYVNTQKETYSMEEVEQCGEIQENQKMIRRIEDQCDEYGENCEACYMVEEYDWKVTDTKDAFASFKLGNYTIVPNASGNYIGTNTFTEYVYDVSKTTPIVGDERYIFTYLTSNQNLLVAGEAYNNKIEGTADRKPFVISNKSYVGTLDELQAQDRAAGWMFRIISLLAMMFGMLLIVGPLTLMTNFMRFIPGLGKHVEKGFDSVVKFFALLVGLVLWLIIYAIVILLKNIWIALIVLAVIGAIVFFIVQKGKKEKKPVAQ